MVYGAIDLHSRFSQIRIVDAEGAVRRERRVLTSRDVLCKAFADCGSVRILLEARLKVSGSQRRSRPPVTR